MAAADAKRIGTHTRLLVVAPHPDDETLAAGLLMQRVLAAGGSVDVLLLTDGDDNPWPQRVLERRVRIDAAARARLARRRRDEIHEAMRRLGLPPDRLHALSWPDQGVARMLLGQTGLAVQTVAAVLASTRPDLVVLPALADRHPDHGSAHVVLRLALAAARMQPEVWTYMVHGRREPVATMEMEGDSAARAVKHAALAAHASQLVLAPGRLWRLAAADERFSGLVRPAPGCVLPWRPPRWITPWLGLAVVGQGWARFWNWRQAPLRRSRSGGLALDPEAIPASTPCFARLHGTLRSPWIFDHWGWCELA